MPKETSNTSELFRTTILFREKTEINCVSYYGEPFKLYADTFVHETYCLN